MSKRETPPRPVQAGPLGHGYCWKVHPTRGVHCNRPIGHQGSHTYPYVRPEIHWT